MKKYGLILSILFILASCYEQDEVLPKIESSKVDILVDLGPNQASFLDLSNINTSSTPEFEDWQLKFQNDENGWAIYLNTLSQVAVYNTRITKYDSISEYYNTSNVVWQLDVPTSSGSFPGIGTWGDYSFTAPQSYKNVYLIRWVKNGTTQVYKMQILDAREGAYHIRYGSLNGAYVNSVWIEKNTQYQHSYYSLALDKILPNVEPSKDSWHLCLTYLSDSIKKYPLIPYVATANESFGIYPGLIINRTKSLVYLDTSRSLEDITYFNSHNLPYSRVDELYNTFGKWDAETQQMVANDKIVVIIKDEDNLYAIKPLQVRRSIPGSLGLQLEIKKL